MDNLELLAPAGSYETMLAAFHGGADAVYIGASRFGARAYADNPDEAQLLSAIDYAHLHGKKLFITVNTLLKEQELEKELDSLIAPLYHQGVDGIIVQDPGVLYFLHHRYPDLPLHASTQMAVSGADTANRLWQDGISRVVMPRELSLEEIRSIHQACPDLEIEAFVHGALCYCYSGQCLFSSLAGGRSGNRGRCAQPCRMPYTLERHGKVLAREAYLLSLKDLNTIDLLPEIIESGVTSLKIEGRMKKPVYTAGVVEIYRKYLDLYRSQGTEGYRVDAADREALLHLFNRSGFTQGYYKAHNRSDMITRKKPEFRIEDEALTEHITQKHLNKLLQEPCKGRFRMQRELPLSLTVFWDTFSHTAQGPVPQTAMNQGLTSQRVEEQLKKTGQSPYLFQSLHMEMEEGLFVPMGQINALRREALDGLAKQVCTSFRRQEMKSAWEEKKQENHMPAGTLPWTFSASVMTKEQLEAVLDAPEVMRIYLAEGAFSLHQLEEAVESIHQKGKLAYLHTPPMVRDLTRKRMENEEEALLNMSFDGVVLGSTESLPLALKMGGHFIGDHYLYSYNHLAKTFWEGWGISTCILPAELNRRELQDRGVNGEELLLYGHLPMMLTANCLLKSMGQCSGKENGTAPSGYLIDRLSHRIPFAADCKNCMNILYNPLPVSLCQELYAIRKWPLWGGHLRFTIESGEETSKILEAFRQSYAGSGKETISVAYTTGHYKRGVE